MREALWLIIWFSPDSKPPLVEEIETAYAKSEDAALWLMTEVREHPFDEKWVVFSRYMGDEPVMSCEQPYGVHSSSLFWRVDGKIVPYTNPDAVDIVQSVSCVMKG